MEHLDIYPITEDEKGNITEICLRCKEPYIYITQEQAFKLVSLLYSAFHGQIAPKSNYNE